MKKDDTSDLTLLGSDTHYKYEDPSANILESFPNKHVANDYQIDFKFEEFTSLCPKTGQPDFAKIHIQYIPGDKCVETKSLKLYFFAYRNCGSFMETITNNIKDDLVKILNPKFLVVIASFASRPLIDLATSYTEEPFSTSLTDPSFKVILII